MFINFWASWCFFCLTQCLSEVPAIQRVSEGYGDRIVMLGVNISDTPEDIAACAANNGIHYPLPMDTERAVMEVYGGRQMPTSIFMDADGVVPSAVYGVIAPDRMRAHRRHAPARPLISTQRKTAPRDVWTTARSSCILSCTYTLYSMEVGMG